MNDNIEMKNEFKVISTFLILNAAIISIAMAFYMKRGIQFEKIAGYFSN